MLCAHVLLSVEFIPTLFFPAENSTEIYPKPQNSSLRTPTDAELSAIITFAKEELGLRTVMSPMFDPDYDLILNGQGDPGAGRAQWGVKMNDTCIAEWFTNYGHWIMHYAKLAQELGMDTFHAMHELHTMGTNASLTPQWRSLLTDVRVRGELFSMTCRSSSHFRDVFWCLSQSVFDGEVSVAFNGNPFFKDVARGGIGYIDLLDSIGLDCYWPLVTELPEQPWQRPGVDVVAKAWEPWVCCRVCCAMHTAYG